MITKEQNEKDSDTNNNPEKDKTEIKKEDLSKIIESMISDQKLLQNGYQILSNNEYRKNFYFNLLQLCFEAEKEQKIQKMKLCGSVFHTFIKQNYESEDKITNEEKLNIVSYILTLIDTNNYYLKNLIANVLGFIAAKEFPNCYESFIKILLDKLNANNESNINENQIDEILRIFISVLKYCEDECAIITGSVLPVIINIFKISKNNQKNREKCLIIISLFLNKLSYADGNDVDLLSNSLDSNSLMENSISLFTSILISNPKMLLDIKKYTIRILDILVRDMPIYSSKFFNLLIEPAWRLIVLELSLYCNSVVFNKEIEYTEDEEITIEEENHIYEHGYESDDDDEINGMEG